ncbi:MAG TPA: hypothetical protein VE753_08670 [Gaiellaceae bacterium]|jgi:hypothetical protein|nr:hypothetical protein [Gaiellaceae bacterium]
MRLLRWLMFWRRRRPPPLDETAAYERLHGGPRGDVRVVAGRVQVRRSRPRKPRLLPKLTGDHLRRCFEDRLSSRRSATNHAEDGDELARLVTSAPSGAERKE